MSCCANEVSLLCSTGLLSSLKQLPVGSSFLVQQYFKIYGIFISETSKHQWYMKKGQNVQSIRILAFIWKLVSKKPEIRVTFACSRTEYTIYSFFVWRMPIIPTWILKIHSQRAVWKYSSVWDLKNSRMTCWNYSVNNFISENILKG